MGINETFKSLFFSARVQGSLTFTVLFTLTIVFTGWYLATSVSLYLSRRQFRALNGCQSVTNQYPSKWFGINFILDASKSHGERRYLDALTDNFRRIGYTHEVRALGGTSIWTVEPENIKAVLTTKFKDFSLGNRPAVMGPLLGRGVFVTDGEEWSHSRALLRPNFAKEQVADLSMIERHMQQMLKNIPDDGNTIDLMDLILGFTLDSSTEFLFGESTETLVGRANRKFSEAFKYSLNDISLGLRLGPWHKFRRTDPKAVESHRICREYADKYVDQAVEYREKHFQGIESGVSPTVPSDNAERRTFLKELAMATGHREKLRDELLSLLLAGRDTTASLISSLLFSLARNPEAWSKVKAEVQQTLRGELPTYEQLRDLKYAKRCVNETLRLYPPVPNNDKIAIRDTVLPRGGGPDGTAPILVPKDAPVIFTVYSMHRRYDIFGEDAEIFRPERWENQKYSWEYLPFNGGPRICLGQQYALTETLYVLVRFAQEFEKIELMDPEPWTESLHLTVSSANGVKVKLQRSKFQN
ncbi:Cytochrome P450 monooxygenase fsdH [Lachnellula arida]|uniref:Cytochrome P450 monooxygenase fsdH n=1 Tax=Lachnellula arida TaxID=1316785 RepID=A0A8T9B0J7_9HELO|nr:Cytochrome P450 monooxygenase fsdH [Lachnellula arida]